MPGNKYLLVTIDVECDKSSTWHTKTPVSFWGVLDVIPNKLQPLFEKYAIRPTYLLSPEVIINPGCQEVLRDVKNCELGCHLHGDYIVPNIKTWDLGGTITDNMQWEYPPELEREKLAVLTQMFIQQYGFPPVSFRAGRFGIGHRTGEWLTELGYKVDSSVTPHITWTSSKGIKFPDFQDFPEAPYRISYEGDIWRTGQSDLLEIPITITNLVNSGDLKSSEVKWFRPFFSDTPTLKTIAQHLANEDHNSKLPRPLVMMFHNVELIPGGSPYPQSEEEVTQYLDGLSSVFEYAVQLGYTPCTLSEYYLHFKDSYFPIMNVSATTHLIKKHDLRLKLSSKVVKTSLTNYKTPPWFQYIFDERVSRWDVCIPSLWIVENIIPDKNILENGCGVGFNLMWLEKQGFQHLSGFDIDPAVINAGIEISQKSNLTINLWVDDGLAPRSLPNTDYSVIMALNWTFLIDGFSLSNYIETYLPYLENYGVLIFDVIDAEFNKLEDNQYLSSDLNKPANERRPSEYKVRLSEDEVRSITAKHGLMIVQIIAEEQKIPKKVYIVGRHTLFEIYNENHKSGLRTEKPPSNNIFTAIKKLMTHLKFG
jgi:hypothetical protein